MLCEKAYHNHNGFTVRRISTFNFKYFLSSEEHFKAEQ